MFTLQNNAKLIIENYIEGDNFFTLLEKNLVNEEILINIGESISKIHLLKDIEIWQDTEIKNFEKNDWIASVKLRNERNLNDMKYYSIINDPNILLLERYFERFINDLQKDKLFLCPIHGDFNPKNISISRDNKVNGIFDFELHKLAHNLNELGIFYYWLKFYEKEKLFHQVVRGYENLIPLEDGSNKIIEAYYVMQIIGAISFLIKNNLDNKAVERLKIILNEFLDLKNKY